MSVMRTMSWRARTQVSSAAFMALSSSAASALRRARSAAMLAASGGASLAGGGPSFSIWSLMAAARGRRFSAEVRELVEDALHVDAQPAQLFLEFFEVLDGLLSRFDRPAPSCRWVRSVPAAAWIWQRQPGLDRVRRRGLRLRRRLRNRAEPPKRPMPSTRPRTTQRVYAHRSMTVGRLRASGPGLPGRCGPYTSLRRRSRRDKWRPIRPRRSRAEASRRAAEHRGIVLCFGVLRCRVRLCARKCRSRSPRRPGRQS